MEFRAYNEKFSSQNVRFIFPLVSINLEIVFHVD